MDPRRYFLIKTNEGNTKHSLIKTNPLINPMISGYRKFKKLLKYFYYGLQPKCITKWYTPIEKVLCKTQFLNQCLSSRCENSKMLLTNFPYTFLSIRTFQRYISIDISTKNSLINTYYLNYCLIIKCENSKMLSKDFSYYLL